MRIEKTSLLGSPYLGVFSRVTDNFVLLPNKVSQREESFFSGLFSAEIIKSNIADSPLVGALSVGFGKKLLISELALDSEIKLLESRGLKVMKLRNSTAVGNLIALTEKNAVCSNAIPERQVKDVEKFFGVKAFVIDVAGSDLVGSSIVVAGKGFIVNPGISKDEFSELERIFGVEGVATTANYGDRFVANSVVANSSGVAVGERTSGPELARIDDAFSKEQ